MLNIPEEVKALFKTSDVKKNIRISFPNGERDDITNENLIAESLSFTESICSQESLKFGLIEAPVLEFETVGVDNIKGMDIEASIEIGAASIPLGRFIVDSSQRQADMSRRKVTAYGLSYENMNVLNEVEQAKRMAKYSKNTSYKMDVEKFVYSNLAGDFVIPNAIYNESSLLESWDVSYEFYWLLETEHCFFSYESAEKDLYRVTYNSKYTQQTLRNAVESYFEENLPDWKEKFMSTFDRNADSLFYPEVCYRGSDGAGYRGCMKGQRYLYPYSSRSSNDSAHSIDLTIPKKLTIRHPENNSDLITFTIREDEDVLLEYVVLKTEDGKEHEPIWLEFPRKKVALSGTYKVTENMHSTNEITEAFLELKGGFGLYNRNGDFVILKLAENFGKVNGGSISKSDYGSVWYEDKQSYPYGIVSAIYVNEDEEEAYAVHNISKSISRENVSILKEVSASREVYFQWLNVSTGTMLPESGHLMIEAPYPIESVLIGFDYYWLPLEFEGNPNIVEISSDNFYFPDITEIQVVLKAQESYSGNVVLSSYEPVEEYYKADECIQYDLSNNYLIQNCTFTQEQIEETLKGFANSIKNVRYMPCELELVGLPYIEAGDVVEVETDSGNFITLVERRTMTGIQALFDSWESQASDEHIIIGESSSYGGGSSGGGSSGEGANKTIVDSALSTTSTNPVQNKVITARLNEVFQSVSDGKELIASAITDKGIETDATASFETMAANISKIEAGGGGSVMFKTDSLDDNSVQQYVVTRIGTATTGASTAATRSTISTVTNGSAELLITTPGSNGGLYYCAKTYIISRNAEGTISFNSQSYSKTNVVAVIGG